MFDADRPGADNPAMPRAFAFALLLLSGAAHASFNGGPCRDFACHFGMLAIVGVAGGIPVFGVIFAVLHMAFRHPERSQLRQGMVGAFAGVIAFVLCAAGTALMAAWGRTTIGHNESYPWIGLVSVFLACAVASALYARSSPHGSAGA